MTESQKSGIVMSAHGWNAPPVSFGVCVARLDTMVG